MNCTEMASVGGYDHKFVDPPHDLICLICTFIAREPHQVDCCGKIYCKTCINELQKRGRTCPNCRKRPRVFNDRLSERRIKTLRLSCKNEENGCQWLGMLEEFERHVGSCEFATVSCPNGCSDKITKPELESHTKTCPRRKHECSICKESGPYEDIVSKHPNVCPEMAIACPNKCGTEQLRRQLEAHLSICPREVVPCTFAKAGCIVSVMRQNLRKHMTNAIDRHQFLAMDKITNLERKVREAETLFRTPPFTFKLENFSTKVATSTQFESPCFYTHENGYKMYIIVRPNLSFDGEVFVGVFVSITEGRNDSGLIWPFKGKIKIELLNQKWDDDHLLCRVPFEDGKQGDYEGIAQFINHGLLNTTNHQYLQDDRLYFRVSSAKASATCRPWLTCTLPQF